MIQREQESSRLFSYNVAPLKEPSKILTGCNTNLGPTSLSDIFGPSLFGLDFEPVEEEVGASRSVGGVSRICCRHERISCVNEGNGGDK